MEQEFQEMQLPVFSEVQTEYILMKSFVNPHNVNKELAARIIKRDEEKDDDIEKKYEVEHTYIDFRMMIIGAKINYAKDGKGDFRLN